METIQAARVEPSSQTREPFLLTVQELACAYQAFANYSDSHVRQLGLTPPQFDVITSLGNTPGLTMNRLGEQTLVTKGTLTGIVDRLEQKGLVRREVPQGNRRSFKVVLTPEGEKVFQEVFPAHVAYLRERFKGLSPIQLDEIRRALTLVRGLF